MKKIIFLILTISLIVSSCSNEPVDPALTNSINNSNSNSSSGNTNSNSGVYMWKFKLDGVLYQWSGTLQNPNNGGGFYSVSNNKGIIGLSINGNFTVSIFFPNYSTGTFTFNNLSQGTTGFILTFQNSLPPITYDTSLGGTMNVEITSISNISIATNPIAPGKVIGTFSGTIKNVNTRRISSITEGVFEVWRGV